MTQPPRTPSQATKALDDVRLVLDGLTPAALATIHHRMTEARRGYPSGHEPPPPDPDGSPSHSDRTGDLACRHDQVEADIAQWSKLIAHLWATTAQLSTLARRWSATGPTVRWCQSCRRDGGHHEPIATGRYDDACRWCGDMRGANGAWPSMELLRAHRRGQAITTAMLARAHQKLPRRSTPT